VTFKGGRNTVFEEYMKMAEQQLKEGRYLDAAGTYQSAGQMSPDNPLALVGRAHAQLAAGMYLAAVEDLQVVFERKPEMIAVRYDLSAFIPKQRLDNLLKDVATLTRADRFNPTASFALAYMDYQTGRTDDLKLTLEMWKRLRPKDPWPKVLEKAWLDEVKKEK
jgi:tetratricopeptide (TPR) repeat protein